MLPKTRDTEYQEIPVDLHDKGLYLIEVAYHELRAYTLLMVTDLALVSKTAPGQVLLFVVAVIRHAGGGATAVVFNNHQELARGATDASGVFKPPLRKSKLITPSWWPPGSGCGGHQRRALFLHGHFRHRLAWGSIYTDRPVYRPTHEVDFKGIVRAKVGGQFSLDVPGPLVVEVTDTNQKIIYQQKLELSPFSGSFHGTLTLSRWRRSALMALLAHW